MEFEVTPSKHALDNYSNISDPRQECMDVSHPDHTYHDPDFFQTYIPCCWVYDQQTCQSRDYHSLSGRASRNECPCCCYPIQDGDELSETYQKAYKKLPGTSQMSSNLQRLLDSCWCQLIWSPATRIWAKLRPKHVGTLWNLNSIILCFCHLVYLVVSFRAFLCMSVWGYGIPDIMRTFRHIRGTIND